jgi:hypothetical protein
MADKLLKLEQEFNAATIQARNTFDKLQKWNTFPDYLIKQRQAEYDEVQQAYKDAQERKNNAKKEFEAAKEEEAKKKEGKAAESVYNRTLASLAKAEAGIKGYQGEERYIAAYQAAQEAFNSVTGIGFTPKKALPEPKIALPVVEEQGAGATGTVEIQGPTTYSDALTFLTNPKNKESLIRAQEGLKNFGYKGNTKGEPDVTFTAALNKASTDYSTLPAPWRTGSLLDFIVNPTAGATGTGTGGSGAKYDPYGTLSVWDKTKTKAELTTLFDNLGIDRDPTAKEVNSIYAQLDKKQKEQKATVTKYKMINGVRTAVTTPGFNQAEFVTDLIKNSQEYKDIVAKKAKQEESKGLVVAQTLQSVADKNGITLSPDELNTFAERVNKGEDVSIVGNDIRKLASWGQPDSVKKLIESGVDLSTIYSPYKSVLAQTLEVNPNSISMNDPTLRMAIGPEKEMSLYEYQRALRKDNRWQYTNQARGEAADVAKTVLKDFGFMG